MRKNLIKVMSKLFSFLGGVFVTLVAVFAIVVISIFFRTGQNGIRGDVVKRLASPNRQWAAFLIIRNDGSERNIDVVVLPIHICQNGFYFCFDVSKHSLMFTYYTVSVKIIQSSMHYSTLSIGF